MSYIFQTDLRNVKKQFNSFRYLEGTSIRYSPKKNLPIILLADVPDSAVNKIDFHLFERYPELSTIIKKSIYLSQQFECDVIYSYFSKSVDTEISCLIVKGKLEELIIYSPEILQTKEGRKFYYKFD